MASSELSADLVRLGYRLFLGREAENDEVVHEKLLRLSSVDALKREFLESAEFRIMHPALVAKPMSGNEPPMRIDDVIAEADLQRLFAHIQTTWQQLGDSEPHYSVLTSEEFFASSIRTTMEQFYASGSADAERIADTLVRNDIDPSALRTCIEYGCGVGRVTPWLASRFEHVTAYDISRSHLQMAEHHVAARAIDNASFVHVQEIADLDRLPQVDFVFTAMVLQHNPPPLIERMIQRFLEALRPGGVALFQVPTYRLGYTFSLEEYLVGQVARQEIEMHAVPQRRVFELIAGGGCRVLEVLEDGYAGIELHQVSNSFLVQRPPVASSPTVPPVGPGMRAGDRHEARLG